MPGDCVSLVKTALTFSPWSFFQGDVEEVRKLLALGVDPNLKDNAGWTPLVSVENAHTNAHNPT